MEIELEARLLQQIVKVVDSLDINTLPLFACLDRLECIGVDEHHMAMAAIEVPTSVFTGYQAATFSITGCGRGTLSLRTGSDSPRYLATVFRLTLNSRAAERILLPSTITLWRIT